VSNDRFLLYRHRPGGVSRTPPPVPPGPPKQCVVKRTHPSAKAGREIRRDIVEKVGETSHQLRVAVPEPAPATDRPQV